MTDVANPEVSQIEWTNKLVLAPLTRGGNLPFRRLCKDFGADITVSEMAYARSLLRGEGKEFALLRSHTSEDCFGVQLAAKDAEEALQAAQIAVSRGAKFIDINCGCPIHDTTRRGLGAALLEKPNKIGRMLEGLSAALSVPVTVKIRLGWTNSTINYLHVAQIAENSGAKAITLHARTREQRYTKNAQWEHVAELVKVSKIPVIGNGDILTHYEAKMRKDLSNCQALMIGRGALIKPWIFQEIKENKTLNLSAEERVAIYFKLTGYMKEHFGNDQLGKKRSMYFLPWHFSLFSRYNYLPEEIYGAQAKDNALIQSRVESNNEKTVLDRVLASSNEKVHQQIAETLWQSAESNQAAELISKIDLADLSVAEINDDALEASG